jgi:hypothetical protein
LEDLNHVKLNLEILKQQQNQIQVLDDNKYFKTQKEKEIKSCFEKKITNVRRDFNW